MCDFVQGSQAVGCYVIMHEVSIGLYYVTTISRNLRVGSVSGVQAGHYSITVYDIKSTLDDINSDGTVYLLSPALNSTVTVVEMSSTTDISTAVSSTAPLKYSTSLQSTTNHLTIMNTQVPVGSTASTLSVSLTITGGIICYSLKAYLFMCFRCYVSTVHINAGSFLHNLMQEKRKVSRTYVINCWYLRCHNT